jgi:hypothetical protein
MKDVSEAMATTTNEDDEFEYTGDEETNEIIRQKLGIDPVVLTQAELEAFWNEGDFIYPNLGVLQHG